MEGIIRTSTRRDEINIVLKYLRQIKYLDALLMRLEPAGKHGKGYEAVWEVDVRWRRSSSCRVCCGWHAICARYGRASTRKASRGRDNTKALAE